MLHLNFSFTYPGVELLALMSQIPTVGLSKLCRIQDGTFSATPCYQQLRNQSIGLPDNCLFSLMIKA